MASTHDEKSVALLDSDDPVLIAIVTYRNSEDVSSCLSALAKLKERRFEVSICENGGDSAFANLIQAVSPHVDFADQSTPIIEPRIVRTVTAHLKPNGQKICLHQAACNLGYAGGVNLTLRQFEQERWSAVWILNPDTEPHPDSLSALLARARDGYSVVGGRMVLVSTKRIQSYGGHWRSLIARGLNIGMHAPSDAMPDIHAIESALDYVSGASLLATRAFVDDVGPMDERYFLYCEEVDWCLRRKHHRLGYAHEAMVFHAHGSTIGSHSIRSKRSALSVYLDERNRHLLTRRFFPTLYPLVAITTLVLTLQYLAAGAGRNFLVALSGWLAGVRGDEGMPARFIEIEV